jgi:myo-inositol-1(or 4)-monophosphatase
VRDALETAKAAALAGGDVLHERFGNLGAIRSKSSRTDFVTEADVASGVAIASAILERDPAARILVEEDEVYGLLGIEKAELGEGDVWVVDPLDGTTSFIHGYPTYSVSVALVRGLVPVAGAVYNAAAREMNAAATGLGATRDDVALQVSSAEKVSDALVITGFPYDRGEPLTRQLAVLAAFLRAPVHGIRRDGSAAIDCCHVACGRADGFWEYALKPWDMAAGVIIAREAGGHVTDVNGAEWNALSTSILVANPTLHAEMQRLIASCSVG